MLVYVSVCYCMLHDVYYSVVTTHSHTMGPIVCVAQYNHDINYKVKKLPNNVLRGFTK